MDDGWRLPGPDDLTPQQEACLALGQVYWPATRSCHHLLTQGPCGEDEWLVLDTDQDSVICSTRLCPCDPSMPDLCEVEMEDVEGLPEITMSQYHLLKNLIISGTFILAFRIQGMRKL